MVWAAGTRGGIAVNAIELHAPKGQPCGVFICGECKYTSRTQEEAERCCRPNVCDCGEACARGWTRCAPCRQKADEASSAARWDKALKVDVKDYDGWIYDDDADKFHSDLGAFVDDWECDHDEGDEPRGRLYACTPIGFVLNAGDILENATQDHYEDAYDNFDGGAADELQAFLTAWAKANDPGSVEPDFTRAIVGWSAQLEAT